MKEIERLAADLERYNRAYRAGNPLISDEEYDALVERLRALDPDHPYLHTVEPETFEGKQEVRHPRPMLSMEKAYTEEQLRRFLSRVEKAAGKLGIDPVIYRMTPKLDGLAGRDDGKVFATRGNGLVGYEISSAFDKGVVPIGGRGRGMGEIVIVKSYFETHLAHIFEHPRNMVVGIVASDKLNEHARKALADGMVHFVPYSSLPFWEGTAAELLEDYRRIGARLLEQVDYPTDGLVLEVVDQNLREYMGATSHHYRWQIAIKRKGETGVTTVVGIHWQVGRTGNVTPVLEVEPINLSGATIRRVTAHHAGMVAKLKIGPGARIEVIRSGEVIPKLERVIEAAGQVELPRVCPACGHLLEFRGDFLRCPNRNCPAQVEQRLVHWFRTLGTADWFGIKTIKKLVAAGYDTLEKIYALAAEDFEALGFGPVQSRNLAEALQTSLNKPVEDWRFLAAFGIADLGPGDSRRLLEHFRLEEVVNLTAEEISKIDGFGDVTAASIAKGLAEYRETIRHMLGLGFQLERTPLQTERKQHRLAGKRIVFTGKMNHGSRSRMEQEARQLGAVVQSSVSGKTDILVCGRKVGRRKLEKARQQGVKILSEQEYLDLIAEK